MKTERDGGSLKGRARFYSFAPMVPDEIDSHASWDLLLSPLLRPASITYLDSQRSGTSPDTPKRQRERPSRGKGGWREKETIKAGDGEEHGKEKVNASEGGRNHQCDVGYDISGLRASTKPRSMAEHH
ncbi:unnamed protein product [Pleuronectes platessa]|uniref:Uncharacterized protein n=1 Tax=Pleuronectes platessa TaxID=8262 RepID=A0A9N7Y7Y1_PLEPL|nr:unnamed protein product [Pleuronectes platessa]